MAAQADRAGDALAVRALARALSYRQLNERANRVAHHLRSLGVGKDILVGLCLPRSLDMVVAALGIWKAGGAYVPMDPDYPADRLAFMLDDAQAPVLITNPCLAKRLPTAARKIVDLAAPAIAGQSAERPALKTAPDDLAYVIYTSGSTGTPKGVEITHSGLANLVAWHTQAFSVGAADQASHLAGLGFDAAVWELWPYLAAGASVHLTPETARSAPEPLRDWLLAEGITIGFVPTPLAEGLLLLDWPPETRLRILLTGGDALHHYPPTGLPFILVNNYGPTECTVVATCGVISPGTRPDVAPPIGRAITNTQIYLLDRRLRPVRAGDPGEMYIGGAGLARGYHNRPDLTADRFIPNPFGAEPGARLFKTGDVARRLPNGQLAFLGRADDQIKIRGYRIEPNEIVCALNQHPAIRESIVIAREDAPERDKRLVAYVVLNGGGSSATPAALRDFLRRSLPDFMLPAAFVWMEGFPLTPHGKLDRAALPAPDIANTLQDPVSDGPDTPAEQRIAGILAELLGVEEVGREDNFFLLGGHSLLGAQLIARLREAFGVEVALRSLFDAPTVAALSAEIERLASAPARASTASESMAA